MLDALLANARDDDNARTGGRAKQRTLFRDAEAIARSHGLGGVIDSWEPDVVSLRGDALAH